MVGYEIVGDTLAQIVYAVILAVEIYDDRAVVHNVTVYLAVEGGGDERVSYMGSVRVLPGAAEHERREDVYIIVAEERINDLVRSVFVFQSDRDAFLIVYAAVLAEYLCAGVEREDVEKFAILSFSILNKNNPATDAAASATTIIIAVFFISSSFSPSKG